MDENKMIRPMDFVRLTNIDELNVIKDTKNHIGLVKEVSRDGYEWIRRMRKFENKADRHTFQKVFGNKRGNELWDCFLEVGRSIFILEDSYFLINDRNVFSLCLAECSDYDLYELVHNIDTDSDQGK